MIAGQQVDGASSTAKVDWRARLQVDRERDYNPIGKQIYKPMGEYTPIKLLLGSTCCDRGRFTTWRNGAPFVRERV